MCECLQYRRSPPPTLSFLSFLYYYYYDCFVLCCYLSFLTCLLITGGEGNREASARLKLLNKCTFSSVRRNRDSSGRNRRSKNTFSSSFSRGVGRRERTRRSSSWQSRNEAVSACFSEMERAGGRLKWRSWVVLAALTKHSKARRESREDDDEHLKAETTTDAETATRRTSESSASSSCTEKSVTEPCRETWTPMGFREATTIIDPETSTTVTDLETTSIFPDMTTVTERDAEIMEDEEWAITSRMIVTESPAVLRQQRIERIRNLAAAADSSPTVSSSLICSDWNSALNSRFAALRAHFNNAFQAIPDHLSNATSLLDGCCRRPTDRSA